MTMEDPGLGVAGACGFLPISGYGYASLGYAVYMACSGSVPILVLQLRSLRADASPEAVDQARASGCHR